MPYWFLHAAEAETFLYADDNVKMDSCTDNGLISTIWKPMSSNEPSLVTGWVCHVLTIALSLFLKLIDIAIDAIQGGWHGVVVSAEISKGDKTSKAKRSGSLIVLPLRWRSRKTLSSFDLCPPRSMCFCKLMDLIRLFLGVALLSRLNPAYFGRFFVLFLRSWWLAELVDLGK